mmetsp:Transcript_15779/g.40112  ORF Transcript_15779/g.40112 Transcript_15779/m.40112 type:complete len:220 (+) Transcript_15779:351-1010(+)
MHHTGGCSGRSHSTASGLVGNDGCRGDDCTDARRTGINRKDTGGSAEPRARAREWWAGGCSALIGGRRREPPGAVAIARRAGRADPGAGSGRRGVLTGLCSGNPVKNAPPNDGFFSSQSPVVLPPRPSGTVPAATSASNCAAGPGCGSSSACAAPACSAGLTGVPLRPLPAGGTTPPPLSPGAPWLSLSPVASARLVCGPTSSVSASADGAAPAADGAA